MEKYSLEQIIDDAWKSCIIENNEKEYVAEENVAVLVASFETCKQRIDPKIISSEAVEMGGFKGGIIIIKEQMTNFQTLKFVVMHEMGHILHGDTMEGVSIDQLLLHEIAADRYAVDRGGFSNDDVIEIISDIYNMYKKGGVEFDKEFKEFISRRLNSLR